MHEALQKIIDAGQVEMGSDQIWLASMETSEESQNTERDLREKVAAEEYENYLETISLHHSIPVMDHEVDRFLQSIPENGCILDVGGAWGWHWRRLPETRPDVGVLVMDFIKANLVHAQNVLGPIVGDQVQLMHADATALPFATANDVGFDGVWTVQTLQHIPDFDKACQEACRVLKSGGVFANYSLHITPFNRLVYFFFRRHYHTQGVYRDLFHLTRANDQQLKMVNDIFGNVTDRYTEFLFHPDLRVTFSGREAHWLGRMDASLAECSWLGRLIARQRSFHAIK